MFNSKAVIKNNGLEGGVVVRKKVAVFGCKALKNFEEKYKKLQNLQKKIQRTFTRKK